MVFYFEMCFFETSLASCPLLHVTRLNNCKINIFPCLNCNNILQYLTLQNVNNEKQLGKTHSSDSTMEKTRILVSGILGSWDHMSHYGNNSSNVCERLALRRDALDRPIDFWSRQSSMPTSVSDQVFSLVRTKFRRSNRGGMEIIH